jgi:ABC-type uncharacterized transport system permease subunit
MVFFSLQAIVFLSFDQSQRYVAKEILSGGFDYILMRPLNLGYFKYFRVQSLLSMFLVCFYISATLITGLMYQLPLNTILLLILYVFIAGFVAVNIRSGMRGLVFFMRDALNTSRVEESLNIFVINKPPEIFPLALQTILTVFLPFMVVHNNAFDLVREMNLVRVWFFLALWVALSITFNKAVWHFGLRRYESG